MTNRRWLLLTILVIAALFGANFLLSYHYDVYGMLRDPQGRSLASSGLHVPITDDRVSKYMLNQRYVPANFDSLLLGSSMTGNWNPDLIHGFSMYNESLAGGNANEEKVLVDQALRKGHFRLALCVVSPYMFDSHDLKQGLGDIKPREALGSINLFSEEVTKLLISLHLQKPTFLPNGARELQVHKRLNYILPAALFTPDPPALAAYQATIRDLQARGVQIVYLVPPVYTPLYDANRPLFNEFLRKMKAELPAAPMIDFTAPDYAGFNAQPGNFSDGIHLTQTGADQIVTLLNAKLSPNAKSCFFGLWWSGVFAGAFEKRPYLAVVNMW